MADSDKSLTLIAALQLIKPLDIYGFNIYGCNLTSCYYPAVCAGACTHLYDVTNEVWKAAVGKADIRSPLKDSDLCKGAAG
jgi:hypothetical protein